MTSSNLVTSQSPRLQIPSHWRLGLQRMNLGGEKILIPSGQLSPIGQRETLQADS